MQLLITAVYNVAITQQVLIRNYSVNEGMSSLYGILYRTITRPISNNQVRRLQQDNDGNIWVGTFGEGVDILNVVTGAARHIKARTTSQFRNLYRRAGIQSVAFQGRAAARV
ncbi:two-component regulator propeller domain-containing protein [Niabella aquatica]